MGFALFLFVVLPVFAQPNPGEKGSIEVDILVNFNSAYREGTWVPVTVLMQNTERDFSGSLEVRSRSQGGTVQSPTYRMPVESPLGSRKQFRFHCFLQQTGRIEVMLYDKNDGAH